MPAAAMWTVQFIAAAKCCKRLILFIFVKHKKGKNCVEKLFSPKSATARLEKATR
jgi:hypothetical protein